MITLSMFLYDNGLRLERVKHYSCVVIILFNMDLYKSAFSIYTFLKLVFCLYVICNFHRLKIIFYIGIKYSLILFSLCLN